MNGLGTLACLVTFILPVIIWSKAALTSYYKVGNLKLSKAKLNLVYFSPYIKIITWEQCNFNALHKLQCSDQAHAHKTENSKDVEQNVIPFRHVAAFEQ